MSFDQCWNRKTSIIQLMINLILSDIVSWSWVISTFRCVGVSILLVLIGNGEDIVIALQMPDVVDCETLLYYVLDTGFLFQLCIVFVAANSSTVYVRDKDHCVRNNLLLRIPCKYYLLERGFQCYVSSFLETTVLCVMMILICRVFVPLGSFEVVAYLTIETSFVIAFWCEVGLALSVFVPNRFVAMVSPFVLQYIVGRICFSFMPEYLNPTLYLGGNLLVFADSDEKFKVLIQGGVLFTVATLAAQTVFCWKANKEIMSGK